MEPTKPSHNACIKLNGKWHKIGVAWKNENDTFNIQIDPLIQLPVGPVSLNLFPDKFKARDEARTQTPRSSTRYEPEVEDDRPF